MRKLLAFLMFLLTLQTSSMALSLRCQALDSTDMLNNISCIAEVMADSINKHTPTFIDKHMVLMKLKTDENNLIYKYQIRNSNNFTEKKWISFHDRQMKKLIAFNCFNAQMKKLIKAGLVIINVYFDEKMNPKIKILVNEEVCLNVKIK